MPVVSVNHINIRTADAAASAQFYVDVLGFKFRQEPGMVGQRNWLVDGSGQSMIHFRVVDSAPEPQGMLDHLALNCEGKEQILERLRARNAEISVIDDVRPGETRIFVKDPNGLMLELYFANE